MKALVVFVVIGAVLAAAALLKGKEKRPQTAAGRLRESIEEALGDVDGRVDDLRDRARRAGGDARRKLQDQAHEIEARQRELRSQLDDLRAEAKRLLDKARG